MPVNRQCLGCDSFRDECCGKEHTTNCFKPMDFRREVHNKMAEVNIRPEIVSPLKPAGESKQAKFDRIGKKRQEAALEVIRKLDNLTSSYHRSREDVTVYNYEWTTIGAQGLLKPIEEALERLKRNLLQPAKRRENGLNDGETNGSES